MIISHNSLQIWLPLNFNNPGPRVICNWAIIQHHQSSATSHGPGCQRTKIQVAFNSNNILRDHAHQSYQCCHRMYPIICIHAIMYVCMKTCVSIRLTWTWVFTITWFSRQNAPECLHLMVPTKQCLNRGFQYCVPWHLPDVRYCSVCKACSLECECSWDAWAQAQQACDRNTS